MADLPAADAPARAPLRAHAVLHELPDVAGGYARGDLWRRDVPLDALDADVLRDDGLHVGQQADGGLGVVRLVVPGPPHVVQAGALDHECGVELEHVRTVGRVVEDPPETFEIVLRRRPGQSWHDVVADLQAVLPALAGAPADLLGPVAPVHPPEYVVIEDLDA